MQIKIEIDVKPDELRRFLGLPDVAGLQEDVVRFLRDKVGAAGDSFDPAAVVQGSLDLFKRTPAWKIFKGAMAGWERGAAEATASAENEILIGSEPAAEPVRRKRTASASSKTSRNVAKSKRSAKSTAASAANKTDPSS